MSTERRQGLRYAVIVIGLIVISFALGALADQVVGPAAAVPPGPSWREHVDVMEILLGLAGAYFLWSARTTVARIETSIKACMERIEKQERRHAALSAQHQLVMAEREKAFARVAVPGETPSAEGG